MDEEVPEELKTLPLEVASAVLESTVEDVTEAGSARPLSPLRS